VGLTVLFCPDLNQETSRHGSRTRSQIPTSLLTGEGYAPNGLRRLNWKAPPAGPTGRLHPPLLSLLYQGEPSGALSRETEQGNACTEPGLSLPRAPGSEAAPLPTLLLRSSLLRAGENETLALFLEPLGPSPSSTTCGPSLLPVNMPPSRGVSQPRAPHFLAPLPFTRCVRASSAVPDRADKPQRSKTSRQSISKRQTWLGHVLESEISASPGRLSEREGMGQFLGKKVTHCRGGRWRGRQQTEPRRIANGGTEHGLWSCRLLPRNGETAFGGSVVRTSQARSYRPSLTDGWQGARLGGSRYRVKDILGKKRPRWTAAFSFRAAASLARRSPLPACAVEGQPLTSERRPQGLLSRSMHGQGDGPAEVQVGYTESQRCRGPRCLSDGRPPGSD